MCASAEYRYTNIFFSLEITFKKYQSYKYYFLKEIIHAMNLKKKK